MGPEDSLRRPAAAERSPLASACRGFSGSLVMSGAWRLQPWLLSVVARGLWACGGCTPGSSHLPRTLGSSSQQPLPGHCSDLGFSPSEWTPAPAFPKADVPSTAPPPWGKPWRGPWDARLSSALAPTLPSLGGPLFTSGHMRFPPTQAGLLRNTLSSPGFGPSLTPCPLPRKPTASTWMSPRCQATGSLPPWHPVLSPRPWSHTGPTVRLVFLAELGGGWM